MIIPKLSVDPKLRQISFQSNFPKIDKLNKFDSSQCNLFIIKRIKEKKRKTEIIDILHLIYQYITI